MKLDSRTVHYSSFMRLCLNREVVTRLLFHTYTAGLPVIVFRAPTTPLNCIDSSRGQVRQTQDTPPLLEFTPNVHATAGGIINLIPTASL